MGAGQKKWGLEFGDGAAEMVGGGDAGRSDSEEMGETAEGEVVTNCHRLKQKNTKRIKYF